MAFLTDMKIGKRLGLGFGVILFLMVILMAVGLYNIQELGAQLDRIVKVNNTKIKHSNNALNAINSIYLSMASITMSRDSSLHSQEKSKIEKERGVYKKAFEELEKLEINDEGKKLIAKAKEISDANRDINNKTLEYALAGQSSEAGSQYVNKVIPGSLKLVIAMEEIVKYNEERSKFRYELAMKSIFTARIFMIGMGIFQIILAVLIGLFITRSIKNPVTQGVGFAQRMSDGDMTQQLAINQKDEIGDLASALNTMSANLRGMFKDIAQGVHTMTASATELSAISAQMSQGAEQSSGKANIVASATEEMSSNMTSVAAAMEQASTNIRTVASATEEMTATIGEIARSTERARGITASAVGQSSDINSKINQLGAAANEIGKITEAITAISAQTNLLALNATIEAARAGAAGKGFAVVANEIKELAQQTAAATEDIKAKIGGIQGSTSTTVSDVAKISQTIQEVNEIVTTIAAAIEEQTVVTKDIAGNVAQAAQGIDEVNRNVAQTSMVAGTVAQDIAEVNQAAGEMSSSSAQVRISATELSKVAEQIQSLVDKFKV